MPPPRQQYCKRGHRMAGKNVLIDSRGYRRCRACYRAAQKRIMRERRKADR